MSENKLNKEKLLLQSLYVFLTMQVVMWTFFACYFSFIKFPEDSKYLIIKILLFMEPICFIATMIGVVKRIKLIYLGSVIFLLANTILSIADELGIADILAFFTSLITLILLISTRKILFKDTDSLLST